MLGSGLTTQGSRPKTSLLCSCVVVLSLVLWIALLITVSLKRDDQTAGSTILPASSQRVRWVIQVRAEGEKTHQGIVIVAILTAQNRTSYRELLKHCTYLRLDQNKHLKKWMHEQ